VGSGSRYLTILVVFLSICWVVIIGLVIVIFQAVESPGAGGLTSTAFLLIVAVFIALAGVVAASSLYLRSRIFGRVAFASPEFDRLAERMGSLTYLDPDTRKRYYKIDRMKGAASYKRRVYFGARLFESLTEGERLALAAHEFSHLRNRDGRYRYWRITAPIELILLASVGLAFYQGSQAVWLALLLSFPLWGYALRAALMLSHAKALKAQELRCDQEAVKYTKAQDLLEGLKKSRAFMTPRELRSWGFKIASRTYPSDEERYQAIIKAGLIASGELGSGSIPG